MQNLSRRQPFAVILPQLLAKAIGLLHNVTEQRRLSGLSRPLYAVFWPGVHAPSRAAWRPPGNAVHARASGKAS